MKKANLFAKFAVFILAAILISMISAITVAAVGFGDMPEPTQPTHSINIVPRAESVSYPGEVVLDVHITRLPYADDYGDYGIGWTEFDFKLYYDYTRFEPIPYSTAPGRPQLASSDTNEWLDRYGFAVGGGFFVITHNPPTLEDPIGAVGILMSIANQIPVMNDIVLHFRFRVLENAPHGNNIEFRWSSVPIGVTAAGYCPVAGPSGGIFGLELAEPYLASFGTVNVVASNEAPANVVPPGPAAVFTVTFNANGGALATGDTIRAAYDGQALGTNMPGNPTRGGGFTFAGWSTVPSGLGTPFNDATSVTGNMTVFARWAPPQPGATPPVTPPAEPPSDPIQEPVTPTHSHLPTHQAFMVGFPDDTVRPHANVTRAEVATILFRLITDDYRIQAWSQDNTFPDVADNNWFNNAVSTMTNSGVFTGMPDGTFQPNRTITRAEFAVAMSRFFEMQPAQGSDMFPDISGHWAAAQINALANSGMISGRPDGTFAPNQSITRAEAAALVTRMLGRNLEPETRLMPGMQRWSDNMNLDAWFYLYIQDATNSNNYEINENGGIVWREVVPARNWRLLERPYSTPSDIIGH